MRQQISPKPLSPIAARSVDKRPAHDVEPERDAGLRGLSFGDGQDKQQTQLRSAYGGLSQIQAAGRGFRRSPVRGKTPANTNDESVASPVQFDPIQSSLSTPAEDLGAYCSVEEEPVSPPTEAVCADTGESDALDNRFERIVGNAIDAAIPDKGMAVSTKATARIRKPGPVDTEAIFEVSGSAERTDDGVEFKARASIGAKAGLNVFFGKVYAAVEGFGTLESKGDSAEESVRLLSLGLERKVAEISKDAADFIWGGEFATEAIRQMDENDQVEAALGIEGSVGGTTKVGKQKAELEVGVSEKNGTRYTANGGKLEETDTKITSLFLNSTVGNWDCELLANREKEGDTIVEEELDVSAQGTIDLLKASSAEKLGGEIAGKVGSIAKKLKEMVNGESGAQSDSTIQQVSSVLGLVEDLSPAAYVAKDKALPALKSRQLIDKAELKYKANLKASSIDKWIPTLKLSMIESIVSGKESAPFQLELEKELTLLEVEF